MAVHAKLVTKEQLIELIHASRANKQTVVQCHGCFDIVHPGHIRHLQWAARLGDYLLVTVSADQAIDKGPRRPYVPEGLRAENLAVLEFVDWVYVDPEPVAAKTLAKIRPDIYVKGEEYRWSDDPRFLEERRVVESYGGRVAFSSGDVVFSSTKILGDFSGQWVEGLDHLSTYCLRHEITADAVGRRMSEFGRVRAVVIGDVVRDEYVSCDASHISGEAPTMNLTRLGSTEFWGGAGIVAQHLRGLGARVDLFTNLGCDTDSYRFLDQMAKAGIHTVVCADKVPVVTKTRFVVDGTKVLKVDDLPPPLIDEDVLPYELDAALKGGARYDVAILCDFGYGAVNPAMHGEPLRMLREAVPVLLGDVSGRRSHLLDMKEMDLLCPSEREAREALDDFNSGLSVVAAGLFDKTNARDVILTLDSRGLVVFQGKYEQLGPEPSAKRYPASYLPSMATVVRDPLGCGDALLAAAGMTLAVRGTTFEAALFGSVAAGWQAERLGNTPIDLATLRARTDQHLSMVKSPAELAHVEPNVPIPGIT